MEKAEMKRKKSREKDSTAFFFLQAANELQNYFFSLSGQDQLFRHDRQGFHWSPEVEEEWRGFSPSLGTKRKPKVMLMTKMTIMMTLFFYDASLKRVLGFEDNTTRISAK